MIDLKDLRANPQKYIDGVRKKNMSADIDAILALDAQTLRLQQELQDVRTQQNAASKDIAKLKGDDKQAAIENMGSLKARAKALGDQVAELDPQLTSLLMQLPQPPDSDVPLGKDASDNIELRRWNSPWFDTAKSFEDNKGFKPKSHMELGQSLGLVDFERGVKMAGSRSYVLTGAGLRLHQAVLRFAFDFMVNEQGFTPVSVPVLVREEMMAGTGFFPFGKEQAYEVSESSRGGGYDLFLTGTGEVGLMGLHAGDILDEASLPRKYITVSTCFRREAGAAGKDTRGMIRQHQFTKVELVSITTPEQAKDEHERMLACAEEVLRRLDLHYRVVTLCTGDMGFSSQKTYDIEVWLPGQNAYREISSCSICGDFQARRMNARYRAREGRQVRHVHTLNGSGVAVGRALIAVMETYQQEDGSIALPQALQGYMGGMKKIAKDGSE
jgi:seryl-tRNA synthetase